MSIYIKSIIPIENNTSRLEGIDLKLHYIFPYAPSPQNVTKTLTDLTDAIVKTPKDYKGVVFCCLHVYKNNKLYGKETLPCYFSSSKGNNETFDPLSFTFTQQNLIPNTFMLLHTTSNTGVMITDTHLLTMEKNKLEHAIANMCKYIKKETETILSMPHVDERTTKLHSVEYHISSSPRIYIPFCTLAMRGKDIFKQVDISELGSWKAFFNREFLLHPNAMNNFRLQSNAAFDALKDKDMMKIKPLLRGVYNYIISLFSKVVQKYITYNRDIVATNYRDYVGIVRPNQGVALADCEDISQISHDLVKLFRALYPDNSINKQTTHLGHISTWLKFCDVFIVQGSVGGARDSSLQSHVWTMLSPTKIFNSLGYSDDIDPGSFIIEGTGEANPGMYRNIHHVWHYDGNKRKLINAMLITENNSEKYIGVPVHEVFERNLNYFIEHRSINFSCSNINEFEQVLSLNPQMYHPLRLMIGIHKFRAQQKTF
tara:strand:- start:6850 stop:8304 length:1455 start_codon:yes stop_codon:yes gene_type:complete